MVLLPERARGGGGSECVWVDGQRTGLVPAEGLRLLGRCVFVPPTIPCLLALQACPCQEEEAVRIMPTNDLPHETRQQVAVGSESACGDDPQSGSMR